MGSRRLGLKRMHTLIENLKREINWNGSTFARQGGTVFRWNYIDCATPIISNLAGHAGADGVMAEGDKFSAIFPGPNAGELYTAQCIVEGAHTVAAAGFKVEGTMVATDAEDQATGLNLQGDAKTADDTGMEIILGASEFGGPSAITVGTHAATIDATFWSSDYTDFDCVSIGFRKVQAHQAGHGTVIGAGTGDGLYTDYAVFGVQESDKVQIAKALNGTDTFTDTTETTTDSDNHRFKISVSAAGVVTYQHIKNAVMDGGTLAAPTATQAMTFDDGDVIIPYILIHSKGTQDSEILLKSITVTRTGGGIAYKS